MSNLIIKKAIKTCCGGSSDVIDLPKTLVKNHLDFFRKVGYNVPEYYTKAGIFHVTLQGLTATGALGGTRLSIRCGGNNCSTLTNNFLHLLEQALK